MYMKNHISRPYIWATVFGSLFLMACVQPQATATRQPTDSSVPSPSPTVTAEDLSYSRRTPFVPLDRPAFLTATEATYLPDDDLVLGLEWQGEARAYPIRMLTYHHIVNDAVAERPILITY